MSMYETASRTNHTKETKTMKATTKEATAAKKTAGSKRPATMKHAAPAKRAKKTAAPAPPETMPTGNSGASPAKQGKGATILALIQREGGATAAELQQATGWQAHSVRGFLSTASKKGHAKVSSSKREDGKRVYSVA